MHAVIVFLAIAIQPVVNIPTDRVSSIELNHVVSDSTGEITLVQLIFWEGGHVVAWSCVSNRTWHVSFDHSRHEYVMRITDAYSHQAREVRAVEWVRTWSYVDREVSDRDWLPEAKRRKMWR